MSPDCFLLNVSDESADRIQSFQVCQLVVIDWDLCENGFLVEYMFNDLHKIHGSDSISITVRVRAVISHIYIEMYRTKLTFGCYEKYTLVLNCTNLNSKHVAID